MISVAMAVYNGEKYLEVQLDSIVRQTKQADEIVIVDDCSTDQSMEIIKKFQGKHPNIRVYRNKSTLGYKKNFREVIRLCQGDLIFLSDQDDFWMPEKVHIMSDIMETHPDIQVLASSFEFMDADGKSYSDRKSVV